MNVFRNKTIEHCEEVEEILMDQIRGLHRVKTYNTDLDIAIAHAISDMAQAIAAISSCSKNQAQDGSEQACKSCHRVDCRKRI